jgi:hypothetical protein
LSSAAVSYSQTVLERRIIPAISVSPDVAEVGQVGPVRITIVNANVNCTERLLPGDAFRLDFDLGDGQIRWLPSGVTAGFGTLSPSDFLVTGGPNNSEVTITYQGAPVAFGFEDSIVVDLVLQAPRALRVSRITLRVPNEVRFRNARGSTSWSLVDLSFGTP